MRPLERISVSEWSDKYRYLSNVASSRPGPYNSKLTPALIEIMDCLSETSDVQEVVFMKGAQIGATEIGNNWIGYIMHVAPAATLMAMPTDDTVKRNSKVRIDPMIDASPILRQRIGPSRSRDGGNTISQKDFPGGVLIMTGANSPTAFRSLPVKNIMLDEVDDYPADLAGQGSPIELARMRTNTYLHKRKIYILSTPTVDGHSSIQAEYADSDQRKYYIPCPHCAAAQTIEWEYIKCENGRPETAYLECKHCHEKIEERHKMTAMLHGQWIADNPDHINKRRRGYHLSALYSTLGYTWEEAVRQWLAAKGNDNKKKTFYNTVLGIVWKEVVDTPDWEKLYGRRKNYAFNVPPKGTAFITAGVDVQRDRIEVEIKAWCKRKVNYSIDYRTFYGDPSEEEVWKNVDKIIDEVWISEDNRVIPLRLMAVDSSDQTQDVYAFCRKYDMNKVIPIKGRAELTTTYTNPKPVDVVGKNSGKILGQVYLYIIGVSIIKDELYGWMRKEKKKDATEDPIGYCYFPEYGEGHFKQITAEEKRITTNKRGYRVYEWTLPPHKRNEALDCFVYNRAAAAILQMDRFKDEDWEVLINSYPLKEEVDNPIPKRDEGHDDDGGFLGDTKSFW